MTRLIYIIAFIIIALSSTITGYGQSGNGPFSAPPPPSGNGANSPYGGGINPDDIGPPPDPIDTPFEGGLILLLGAGALYGLKVSKSKKAIGYFRF